MTAIGLRAPLGIPRAGGPGALELLRIGARGVASRRLRSALTAAGIAIGIAAMVAVLAISDSSRASLLSVLDRLGTNLLSVSPGQTFLGDNAALPDEAPAMIRRIGPVQEASSISTIDETVLRTDKIDSGETRGISVAVISPGWVKTDMATLDVRESAAGIRKVIDKLNVAISGQFFNYSGENLPW